MSLRLYIIFLVLVFNSDFGQAQNFEWLKTYGVKTYDNIIDLSSEAQGGVTFITSHAGSTNYDTLKFDTINIIKPPNISLNCIVRLDSNGKVIRARKLGDFNFVCNIIKDNNGNFYISGNVGDSLQIGSSKLYNKNGNLVFAKFDKDLNFIWASQTGNKLTRPLNMIHSSGHLYFISLSKDTSKIGSKTYVSSTLDHIFGELHPTNGSVVWSKNLITGHERVRISYLVNLKGNLYLSGDFGDSKPVTFTKILINKDTIYEPGAFIIQTDSIGNYTKSFSFHNNENNIINCMSTDDEYLYIGGAFGDTLKWGTQTIMPSLPLTGGASDYELYGASLTASLQPRWFYRPKTLVSGVNNYMAQITTSEGYIYFGAIMSSRKIVINNDTIFTKANADLLLFKTDFLGNILWATNGGSTNKDWIVVRTMDAVAGKSVFAGGYFYGTIKLGKFKDTTQGFNGNCWITKISDYSITRGKVSSGPYCAGDTIKIPYSKVGVFDTNNVFIAQLSDEEGNFEKGYRELGRLKSSNDGTILGKLPLFKVSTSANYRIRIMSTSPVVQSYYRRDTLRLLIYSRDKADPGPTETICYGDSIKLNTFGGTKWTWSPKYNMNDSTLRQPIVWPGQSTTYKIIIGDSSGCGAPDTAFKQIIVRQPLKTILAFRDTIVCNGVLRVPFYFTGGDSLNYKYQWYFVSSAKSWFATKKGQYVLKDTLNYTAVSSNDKLAIILKDGCTNKPDTAYLTISQRKPLVVNTIFKDTTLCTGHTLKYKATATGGIAKYYAYQWKDVLSNTVLSTADTLKIVTSKTLKVQLVVNDGCEALGDTVMFEVKVKAELKAITNLRDTMLCSGKTISYTAAGKGGNTTAYKFNWYLNNNLIDTGTTLTSTLALTSTLTLILKDNCSKNDTITKTITIKPAPKADFTWDLACSKTITKFQFTGTKPAAPITTSFRWNFNNEAISSIENPSHKFLSVGTSTSTLTLNSSNGCNDTLKKTIEIKPQSKADFTANDVCETDSAVFINNSVDATSYNWRFGDGLKSTKMSPKHLYNIGGITKTYNVSLVAVVKDGCSDSIIKAISINSNPNSNFTYTLTGAKLDLKATVQGNTKYRWKFDATDSATTTSGNYTHYFTKPGLHNICLKVFNLAECTSQSCQSMTVGLSTIAKPSGFKIYPNPNTGNFTIEIDNPTKEVSIEVYDLLGNLIKTIETGSSKKSYSIEIGVADGIYVVRVSNGGMVWNQKVSVVR